MRIPGGTRLGPYEIETLIGAGGMGEVYRAVDRRLGRAVAVKTPAAGLNADAEAVARFDRENRTYAQALIAFGREQEARDAIANLLATAPPDNLTWLTEMLVWALDGRRDDVVSTLTEERVRWARADLQYSLQLAEYFAILKDNDRAFEWLENAIRCGVVNYPFLSARDPFLANLRGDPRFEPLMAHVKTIWQRL